MFYFRNQNCISSKRDKRQAGSGAPLSPRRAEQTPQETPILRTTRFKKGFFHLKNLCQEDAGSRANSQRAVKTKESPPGHPGRGAGASPRAPGEALHPTRRESRPAGRQAARARRMLRAAVPRAAHPARARTGGNTRLCPFSPASRCGPRASLALGPGVCLALNTVITGRFFLR